MEGKNKKIFVSFFILSTIATVVFYFLPNPALAADSDLLITEIMYDNGFSGNKHQWIEVFNNGEIDVSIKGGATANSWRLNDQYPDTTHKHTFSSDIVIKPKGFLITSPDPTTFALDYPDFSGNVIKASFSLLKTKEATLALFNGLGPEWFSNTFYSPAWGAKGDGKTLEKIDFAKENEASNWQTSYIPGGTPGKKSSLLPPPPVKIEYPDGLIINELLPNPYASEATDEFIEFFNSNSFPVNLSGWLVGDASKKSDSDYFQLSGSIGAEDYLVIKSSDYNFSLNNSGPEEVFLKNPNGEIIDQVSYLGTAKEDYAYALENDAFSWSSTATPGKENIITEEVAGPPLPTPEESSPAVLLVSPEKIYLSEILANPKKDEQRNEYIEIVNREDKAVDMFGWVIRDASKTGKFIFRDHILIEPQKFLALYRPEIKLALNNSAEAVYLFNPAGNLTSSVSWQKTTDNISYNYDGKHWHWSKFLTPGKKNKFDDLPVIKVTRQKDVYKNTTASFVVEAKDKETKHLKYIWDFGDGHKSYLKETFHKYLNTGAYEAKLTVSDASQSVEKSFDVVVKKYPRPRIEIVRIVPNPAGLDSEKETISIRSNSSKKINLSNYKIATGSKNLVNHPIASDIILAPGEEKIITRADSNIVLNNKAGKVALLYPDGKVADEIAYAKEKIEDDEAYAMLDGKWQWISPENKNEIAEAPPNDGEGVVAGASTENETSYATF